MTPPPTEEKCEFSGRKKNRVEKIKAISGHTLTAFSDVKSEVTHADCFSVDLEFKVTHTDCSKVCDRNFE